QGEEWYEPPIWPEEPGALAKMMHFEILVDDLGAAIAHAVAAGARVAEHQPADRDQSGLGRVGKIIPSETPADALGAAIAPAVAAGARLADHHPADRDQSGLRIM